jgi:hypothetical protein
MKDDSLNTYSLSPESSDSMVSIDFFLETLVVEPKTLGWDNSRKVFENGYENLGVVSTPLKCFLNNFWATGHLGYGRNGLVVHKRHWCFFVVARSNLPVQPHYPGMGWGLV